MSEEGVKVVATNKVARRNYEIIENVEAGIVLEGAEVKSVRAGQLNLKESYVRVKNGELFLVGCHINPYSYSRSEQYDPLRSRKLLLHKRQIDKFKGLVEQKGLTLVPLRVYFKSGRAKLEIGLARGKKLFDKRQDVKSKDAKLAMERAMSHLGKGK